MENSDGIRLDKALAHRGLASRREAKSLVQSGHVKVNGQVIQEPGVYIAESDDITVHGIQSNERQTIAVYKPRGYVSSSDDTKNKTIFDAFPMVRRLNTVGRLDKESEGLILLSDDGLITKAITATGEIEKEYHVTVREDVLPWMLEKFEKGIVIEGGYRTKPARAEKLSQHEFSITLREGKKHQIRRMSNAVGLTSQSLKRVRIGNITLSKMKPGHFRKLKPDEVEDLKKVL